MAVGMLTLSSCASKEEKAINKLDRLSERIEKDGSKFDGDDWEEALEELADIHEELQDCDLTQEQLRELGKKEGRLYAVIAKEGSKVLGKHFKNVFGSMGSFVSGLKEGAEENFSEDDANEMENAINGAVEEFSKYLE